MHQPHDVLHRCLELLHDGQPGRADRLVREGLSEAPDEGSLWQLLGLMRRERGDFDEARAALETASVLIPLNPAARCALADCYAREGRSELAGDLYRHLAEAPDCPTALLPNIASGLGSVGDDVSALNACRTLADREPDRHEALFGMAFYMRRLGHPPESIIPVVSRAHELAPRALPHLARCVAVPRRKASGGGGRAPRGSARVRPLSLLSPTHDGHLPDGGRPCPV